MPALVKRILTVQELADAVITYLSKKEGLDGKAFSPKMHLKEIGWGDFIFEIQFEFEEREKSNGSPTV